jgi:hypothetical protein
MWSTKVWLGSNPLIFFCIFQIQMIEMGWEFIDYDYVS